MVVLIKRKKATFKQGGCEANGRIMMMAEEEEDDETLLLHTMLPQLIDDLGFEPVRTSDDGGFPDTPFNRHSLPVKWRPDAPHPWLSTCLILWGFVEDVLHWDLCLDVRVKAPLTRVQTAQIEVELCPFPDGRRGHHHCPPGLKLPWIEIPDAKTWYEVAETRLMPLILKGKAFELYDTAALGALGPRLTHPAETLLPTMVADLGQRLQFDCMRHGCSADGQRRTTTTQVWYRFTRFNAWYFNAWDLEVALDARTLPRVRVRIWFHVHGANDTLEEYAPVEVTCLNAWARLVTERIAPLIARGLDIERQLLSESDTNVSSSSFSSLSSFEDANELE
jgi:hypothetical protein